MRVLGRATQSTICKASLGLTFTCGTRNEVFRFGVELVIEIGNCCGEEELGTVLRVLVWMLKGSRSWNRSCIVEPKEQRIPACGVMYLGR